MSKISAFQQITVRATLQLIQSVSRNYVQYEHISPLLGKINSSTNSLEKVIDIIDDLERGSSPSVYFIEKLQSGNKKNNTNDDCKMFIFGTQKERHVEK